jgi:hypothetical protein
MDGQAGRGGDEGCRNGGNLLHDTGLRWDKRAL